MEKNPYYLPEFSEYYVKQWAPLTPMITAIMLKFVKNQKELQNNQAVESYFSELKNKSMSQPQRQEKSLRDFTLRRNVWEFDDFIRELRKVIK